MLVGELRRILIVVYGRLYQPEFQNETIFPVSVSLRKSERLPMITWVG